MLSRRRSYSNNGNSLSKLQSIAIQKFGDVYSNKDVTIKPTDIVNKLQIHNESTQLVTNNNGCLTTLEKFATRDDETIDDLDMLLY